MERVIACIQNSRSIFIKSINYIAGVLEVLHKKYYTGRIL